jgi:hypothetical protein
MVLEHQIHSIDLVLKNLAFDDSQKEEGAATYFNGIVATNRSILQNIDQVLNSMVAYI